MNNVKVEENEKYEYIFKKDYICREGLIKEGTIINIVRGSIFVNGFMIHPSYASSIMQIINDKNLHDMYLRNRLVITNKV